MEICPLCSRTKLNAKLKLRSFGILRCSKCGLLVQHPLPSQEDLSRIYNSSNYWDQPYFSNSGKDYKRDSKIQMYETAIRKFEQLIPKKGTLLDVGCGTGVFLDIAKKAGWNVYGIECSALAAENANKNFDVPVQIGVVDELSIPENQFQIITLWDVIEHSLYPMKLINTLSKALIPGGIILIFTPNAGSLIRIISPLLDKINFQKTFSFTESVYSPLHIYYFNPQNIKDLMARHSIKVVESYQLPMTPERARSISFSTKLLLDTFDTIGRTISKQYRFVTIGKKN